MVKFIPYKKTHNDYYTETGQSNNLRWTVLYKNADDSYLEQTMMFKCKDYFNDIVAKYHGVDIKVYGMDTEKLKLNEEGMYVKLKFVASAFLENVGSINSYAAQWAMPPIVAQEAGSEDGEARALLFIPREYFDNTYFISLLTYLIRVANADKVFTNFTEHPTKSVDNPFKKHYNTIIKEGFTLPMESSEKFYVITKLDPYLLDMGVKIHNCGCQCWQDMAAYMAAQKQLEAA